MPLVEIYRFSGLFPASTGTAAPPGSRTRQDGILFVRQDAAGRDEAAMERAFAHCGIEEPEVFTNRTLAVAALERPGTRDFVPLHEQALREGAAVVVYASPQAAWQAP